MRNACAILVPFHPLVGGQGRNWKGTTSLSSKQSKIRDGLGWKIIKWNDGWVSVWWNVCIGWLIGLVWYLVVVPHCRMCGHPSCVSLNLSPYQVMQIKTLINEIKIVNFQPACRNAKV